MTQPTRGRIKLKLRLTYGGLVTAKEGVLKSILSMDTLQWEAIPRRLHLRSFANEATRGAMSFLTS